MLKEQLSRQKEYGELRIERHTRSSMPGLLLAIVLFVLCAPTGTRCVADDSVTVRVAAYNVEFSRSATPEQIGELFKPYNLDIIGFNEAPDGDWTERVGKVLAMKFSHVGQISSANHKNKFKTILSRTPLEEVYEHRLQGRGWNPASAVKAMTTIRGVQITFYSLHISGSRKDDGHAFNLATAVLPKEKAARLIIAGDFNNRIGDQPLNAIENAGMKPTWKDLPIELTKQSTWNAFDPKERAGVIDHVFYNSESGATTTDGGIIELEKPLSDHKPVWAEIAFPRLLPHSLETGRRAGDAKRYEPTWESLGRHRAAPKWYEDAVFGIYYHWGVYSVPAFGGEKYYRSMYKQGHSAYEHHRKTYGDPLKFGYHDFIPMFKAEKWDPNRWAELFETAGADFAGSITEHGDGFAMWDTQYDEYNAMDMGPHRDIVGEMAQAVRKRGLKFVTTFHSLKWDFYDEGRRLCPEGVGVNDPRLSGLYGPVHEPAPKSNSYGQIKKPKGPVHDPVPDSYRDEGYNKFVEIIDKYRPDQLQIDGGTGARLGEERLKRMLAHYFNSAREWGKEVVVTRGYSGRQAYVSSEIWGKEVMISRVIPLTCSVQNMERHFPVKSPRPASPEIQQATTPVPGFGYSSVTNNESKTPAQIEESVDALVDGMVNVKSRNGVTLLGVAPRADGTFPDSQTAILKKLGQWMRVNKEALHAVRICPPYLSGSLRYTQKAGHTYIIDTETPVAPVVIPGITAMPRSTITMLGSKEDIAWHQEGDRVVIDKLPDSLPGDYSWVFKIHVGDPMQETPSHVDERAQR